MIHITQKIFIGMKQKKKWKKSSKWPTLPIRRTDLHRVKKGNRILRYGCPPLALFHVLVVQLETYSPWICYCQAHGKNTFSIRNLKVNLLHAGSVYNMKSLLCFVNWTRQITIFSSKAISAFLPNVSISNQLNYFSFWKTFGFDQLNYFSYFRFGEIITFWKNPLNNIMIINIMLELNWSKIEWTLLGISA